MNTLSAAERELYSAVTEQAKAISEGINAVIDAAVKSGAEPVAGMFAAFHSMLSIAATIAILQGHTDEQFEKSFFEFLRGEFELKKAILADARKLVEAGVAA